MTKKDHEKIAKVLRENKPVDYHMDISDAKYQTWENIIDSMAKMLFADNPLFDYRKFYKACGYDD